jgi:hypothetical protein
MLTGFQLLPVSNIEYFVTGKNSVLTNSSQSPQKFPERQGPFSLWKQGILPGKDGFLFREKQSRTMKTTFSIGKNPGQHRRKLFRSLEKQG